MAVGQTQRPPKNIWVAAGDGDLDRVQHLIEQESLSPNVPDPFTYTPIPTRTHTHAELQLQWHAAASYGQIHVLEYLLSRGGDVNVTDNDGDTPLYTVEDVETARWLLQHGAVVARQNSEGISPIDHLAEDFPEVATYLRGTLASSSVSSSTLLPPSPVSSDTTVQNELSTRNGSSTWSTGPSQHSQNLTSEALTSSLMSSVQTIMERAEVEGRDPEEELRHAVERTVLQGVMVGYEMSANGEDVREGPPTDSPSKRSRTE